MTNTYFSQFVGGEILVTRTNAFYIFDTIANLHFCFNFHLKLISGFFGVFFKKLLLLFCGEDLILLLL